MERIKTAVIGSRIAENIFLKTLTDLVHVTELCAIVEADFSAAEQIAAVYGCRAMTFEQLLSDPEIPFVVNLGPVPQRYETIRKLLLAGKHVYTEKPLCTDFAQGKELAEIAQSRGLQLAVGPDIFLGAGLQTARKALDGGWIGRPTSCVVSLNRNHVANSEFFGFVRERDGSFPYDMGVYYLSALLALLGPVRSVSAMADFDQVHEATSIYSGQYGSSWTTPGCNLSAAVLRFSSGLLATLLLDGTSINDERPTFMIYGSEGILRLDQPDSFACPVVLTRTGAKPVELPFTHDFDGSFPFSDPGPFAIFGNRGIGAAECAWSILKNRPSRSGEIGLHMLEILHGIEHSATEHREYEMTTSCAQPRPLPSGYFSKQLGGFVRLDAEFALTF